MLQVTCQKEKQKIDEWSKNVKDLLRFWHQGPFYSLSFVERSEDIP